ncbi:MAG: TonB-dependent receptor plug domain-containing protein, partial [Cellvibrionales bacterium]|nr:TonB-dependent receptor plug domain-containing protein [Cellvibrionales bacterium]
MKTKYGCRVSSEFGSNSGITMTIKAAAVKLVLLAGLAISSLAHAEKMYSINIAIQSMPEALTQLSTQTDIQVIFPYQLAKDKTANAVKGRFSVEHALALLLQGTGLSGGLSKKNVLMISPLGDGSSNDYFNGEDMMNRKKNILASTIAFFVGVGGAHGLSAEESASKSGSGWLLEEVVVTASKGASGSSLQDTAMSISVLSSETISNRGLVSASDYLSTIPGVSYSDFGTTQNKIVIRGLSTGFANADSSVGTYLGEIPLGTGRFDVKLVDIDR